MRPIYSLAVLALSGLAGCATVPEGPLRPTLTKTYQADIVCAQGVPCPEIFVDPTNNWVPGTIEVVVMAEDDESRNPEIVWRAPPGHWFDKQTGIEWSDRGKSVFKCKRDMANWYVFSCLNKGKKDPSKYSYTIKLRGYEAFDPFVLNR